MHYTGVDIIEIERIEKAVTRWGKRFLQRIYTDRELEFCRSNYSSLAADFAAKEAVMKLLGTGTRGTSWREIEVLPDHRGRPLIYLHYRAQKRAQELGLDGLALSLSHSKEYAIACAVGGLR